MNDSVRQQGGVPENLVQQLRAKVQGRLQPYAPLAPLTWFGVGGTAALLFRPKDHDDLQVFLQSIPDNLPVQIVGATSNLLVRDGGINGVVIRLGGGFAQCVVDPVTQSIVAGCAQLDGAVAQLAQSQGIAGLEFLSTIPGSLGGAVRMNAGCYGRQMSDCVVWVEALDRKGQVIRLDAAELGFGYRSCAAAEDMIFTRVKLQGHADDPAVILARMAAQKQQRDASQPVRSKTGGSTFANPQGHKAWQLIDQAGCRGLRVGGAQVSPQHCNFLINTGGATAQDLETLGEQVRARVLINSGVDLQWEIRRIGSSASQEKAGS